MVLGSNATIFIERGRMHESSSSSSRTGIFCEYATQLVTTLTTWLTVMSRKRGYTPRCSHYHQNVFEKAVCSLWYHRLPNNSHAHDLYSKRRLMYVLRGRKREQGVKALWVRTVHTHTCIHTASLSKNRSVAPQNHQNISDVKYFSNARKQFRVLFILKKNSILNFENPLFVAYSISIYD